MTTVTAIGQTIKKDGAVKFVFYDTAISALITKKLYSLKGYSYNEI